MTRKHYIAIAYALRRTIRDEALRAHVALAVADAISASQGYRSTFNRDKFIAFAMA